MFFLLQQRARYGIMEQNQSSLGIILRARPEHKGVIVLDQYKGRMNGTIYRSITKNLLNGSLIEYTTRDYCGSLCITVIEQHAQPAPWASDDIFFVHHILELCRHMLPELHEQPEVFQLLSNLYNPNVPQSTGTKKALLCKLYMLLGMYPSEESSAQLPIPLISPSGDSMLNFQYEYDQQTDEMMTRWLRETLSSLDTREPLKTSSFLKRLGVLP